MTKLLERASAEGAPLIDGDQAVFVWKGKKAPLLIGDFNQWGHDDDGPVPLEKSAPNTWTYTLTLPVDAYIEYTYTTDHADEKARVVDPFNKRRINNGVGSYNHYFRMPQSRPTTFTRVRAGAPQGRVIHHPLKHDLLLIHGKRDLWLYAPPVEEAVPLVVVYDGRDYLRRARLTTIVDNLIAKKRMRPVALALIDNARSDRFSEYLTSEAMLGVLTELVLPAARANLKLLDIDKNPGAYGVLGASMGGLMALYTALRLPHLFGHVISQSGAFHFGLPKTESMIHLLVQSLPVRPLDIWQDVGRYEWLLETNRRFHSVLSAKGYDVSYREYNGGHNYTSWRDVLPEALETIFGA